LKSAAVKYRVGVNRVGVNRVGIYLANLMIRYKSR